MVERKGQAAMEFLMTYGWALLVVLVAIGALAFFGVLNPSQFLPSTCTITPGLHCDDFIVSEANGVTVIIQNGLGNGITDAYINATGCSGSSTQDIADGATGTFTCTGSFVEGEKFSGADSGTALTITYTAGLTHTKTINLVTKVEA